MFYPRLFRSFWLAGFESATHITRDGRRLDMLAATQHDRFIVEDYARLREFGVLAVRDTIRWHLVEPSPYAYDFSSLAPYVHAAERTGVQVIWDLLHYGWPTDIDIFSDEFVRRFASFSRASAEFLRVHSTDVLWFTPVNELSFFAWAAGEVGWFHPFAKHRGGDVKRQLVRAWIASIDAIRGVEPAARFASVEPVIHTVPPRGASDEGGLAAIQRASQWEAWDMICGARDPELGGAPEYLDVVGVNFYHDNQWEVPGGRKIHWHIHPRDPRWLPFHRLLEEACARYQRPFFIGETSHVGVGRAEWIRELTDEVLLALQHGVPLEGICLYPIVDRFEWEDPKHWHNSGLWDFDIDRDGTMHRVLNAPYAAALHDAQRRVRLHFAGGEREPDDAARRSKALSGRAGREADEAPENRS